ncbi:MAG: hypothetical protein ACE144_01440 [Thermodesulfobacteriota bacterium]
MKRLTSFMLSMALCLTIVVGYVEGTRQEGYADDGPHGKYVFSADPTQYVELRSDGSCLVVTREYTPSGHPGKQLESLSGTYEIKGDIVTFILKAPRGDIRSELRLEGNTLVLTRKKVPPGLEGAKYIKK